MLGSLWLFFYLDMECFSKYSSGMLHLTPATRILNENPENVRQVLTTEEKLMLSGWSANSPFWLIEINLIKIIKI